MKWKKRFCLLFTVPSVISKNLSLIDFQPAQRTISELRACTKRKYVLVCTTYIRTPMNFYTFCLSRKQRVTWLEKYWWVGGYLGVYFSNQSQYQFSFSPINSQ